MGMWSGIQHYRGERNVDYAEAYAEGKERKNYAFYIGGSQEVYTTDNLDELGKEYPL